MKRDEPSDTKRFWDRVQPGQRWEPIQAQIAEEARKAKIMLERIYNRNWYAKNLAKCRARSLAKYHRSKDAINKRRRARYHANILQARAAVLIRVQNSRNRNPQRHAQVQKAWRQRRYQKDPTLRESERIRARDLRRRKALLKSQLQKS